MAAEDGAQGDRFHDDCFTLQFMEKESPSRIAEPAVEVLEFR